MPDEPPRPQPPVLDLDEHVEHLLEQVDTECARLEHHRPVPVSSIEPGTGVADSVAPAAEPEEPAATSAEPRTSSDLDADLDAQVGRMIADAERVEDEAEGVADTPPPLSAAENETDRGNAASQIDEPGDEAASSDEGLDDHIDEKLETYANASLADLTSQLLQGGLPPEEEPEAETVSASAESAAVLGLASKPGSITISLPFAAIAGHARRASGRVLGVVLPAGATGVMKLDAPLESRDPTVRQTVGWMALYTGFLALCVWGYVLLIRTPEVPTAATVPAAITGEGHAVAQGAESGVSSDSSGSKASGSPIDSRQD